VLAVGLIGLALVTLLTFVLLLSFDAPSRRLRLLLHTVFGLLG
jgi:hypothetical protein